LRELFIFDTESEKQEDLPSFIDDNWRYGMSTDPSRDPTAAVVEWFVKLHSLGFSLSGNFKATNFALNHSDLLRCERKLLKNLRKLTLKRMRRDMESCGDMIEFDFYNREYASISIATKHLLWLLKHFKPRHSFLVCNHACHEEEDRRISLFEAVCIRLHVLEKIDKPKYNRFIGKLPCCRNVGTDAGSYINEALEYQNLGNEIADPKLLVELQKAMDDEGELAGLGKL
jgi:hypothetical protein